MSQTNFNRLFALLAISAVVIGVIIGFWLLGSPARQRQIQADRQRLEDMLDIARRLHQQTVQSKNRGEPVKLPDVLPPSERNTDPISGKNYEYQWIDRTHYQLCAEFTTESDLDRLEGSVFENSNFWQHPSGRHCFRLNALEEPPN
jgi:hypothetical protein